MTKQLIQDYQIKAKKSLGQNFLVDESKVEDIAGYLDIEKENILEIGPGYGALTEKLLVRKPHSLTLVELDQKMVEILKERFGEEDSISVENIDVLQYHPSLGNYVLIANIPYYITSPILRHFLYDIENKPQKMLILMQQDVGEKILGKGKNKSSVLSLFVEKKCRVSEALLVPKESFHPVPKVESMVLAFEIHSDFEAIDDEKFMNIIKIGFSSARKKLSKNLNVGGFDKQKIITIFAKLEIDENVRGEDLSIQKWCELVDEFEIKSPLYFWLVFTTILAVNNILNYIHAIR